MSVPRQISRRTVLKGLGTAMALPLLETMRPTLALAGSGGKAPPIRAAFLYIPNGAHMADWTPAAVGTDFELPAILEPLKSFKDDLLVLSGLAQDTAHAHGDGPGDHARALACYLTGVHPVKTNGADIRAGVSVDQVAAEKIGNQTRLPSLELGCDRGAQSGNCDSGYSCAYSSNISWKTPTTPVPKEVDPRVVFDRLFSNGETTEVAQNRAKRDRYKKSILDFVREDAERLKSRLGTTDQRKLDEYLTAVREIEQRINRFGAVPKFDPPLGRPDGVPKEYQEHLRLMCDLLVLAFQADVTRVSTFMFANAGSNRSYPFIEVPEGHHDLSHHGGSDEKQAKIAKINRFHVTQFAYLLEKMKAVKEGDATLLDNTMIVYGSGIGDGNRHNHDDLPIVLAGRGRGTIKTGRHVRYDRGTPLNNLWLAMLDRAGAPTESLGDSTGRLELPS